MYCKNCGKQLVPNAAVCTQCGCPVGQGVNHCHNCGDRVNPGAAVCLKCGAAVKSNIPGAKSKLAAGLLGILLGVWGVHNFYLGYTNKAIAQLLLGTVGAFVCGFGPLASWIWGLVEGIQILTGSIKTDAQGMPLND